MSRTACKIAFRLPFAAFPLCLLHGKTSMALIWASPFLQDLSHSAHSVGARSSSVFSGQGRWGCLLDHRGVWACGYTLYIRKKSRTLTNSSVWLCKVATAVSVYSIHG